jgi:hypothetical protein
MQMLKATEIRKSWGNKPCDHPHLAKEYHFGTATGDYICTQYGESGWDSDWPTKEKASKKEKDK